MRIPTTHIDADALPRDRTLLDPHAQDELQGSIRAHGLRMPIEVYATGDRYALLSGYRRLTAIRALHDLTGLDEYTQIDALLRTPDTRAAALAAMVEENEQRQPLSPWERGRIALATVEDGTFATLDDAIPALFPQARRQKRARLRAVAEVVQALDGTLTDPEALSENKLLRLATALRNGWGELLVTAIEQKEVTQIDTQWSAIRPVLDEHDAILKGDHSPSPTQPRRLAHPRAGVTIRRERLANGWCLYVTGRGASERIVGEALEQVEYLLGAPG